MYITNVQKEKIYRDYYKKVFGYVLSKINNYYLSEDLTADIFVKIYDKLDTFDETKSALSTWIYNITRNTVIDYYRTRRVFDEIPETKGSDYSIDDEICNNETLDSLANALEALNKREKEIIIKHYYYNISLTDISKQMNISYSYVKKLQKKAFEILKEKMKNEYPI